MQVSHTKTPVTHSRMLLFYLTLAGLILLVNPNIKPVTFTTILLVSKLP
jgi:hypothetical protein